MILRQRIQIRPLTINLIVYRGKSDPVKDHSESLKLENIPRIDLHMYRLEFFEPSIVDRHCARFQTRH